MRGMNLNAIKTRLLSPTGRISKGLDDFTDIRLSHLLPGGLGKTRHIRRRQDGLPGELGV